MTLHSEFFCAKKRNENKIDYDVTAAFPVTHLIIRFEHIKPRNYNVNTIFQFFFDSLIAHHLCFASNHV